MNLVRVVAWLMWCRCEMAETMNAAFQSPSLLTNQTASPTSPVRRRYCRAFSGVQTKLNFFEWTSRVSNSLSSAITRLSVGTDTFYYNNCVCVYFSLIRKITFFCILYCDALYSPRNTKGYWSILECSLMCWCTELIALSKNSAQTVFTSHHVAFYPVSSDIITSHQTATHQFTFHRIESHHLTLHHIHIIIITSHLILINIISHKHHITKDYIIS